MDSSPLSRGMSTITTHTGITISNPAPTRIARNIPAVLQILYSVRRHGDKPSRIVSSPRFEPHLSTEYYIDPVMRYNKFR